MAGEPTKPKASADVTSAKADARNDSSLPNAKSSTSEDIAAFVARARAMSPHGAGARGRLVFALDATMSRQPTWDMACTLQADMFREAASVGSLDIRLVSYLKREDSFDAAEKNDRAMFQPLRSMNRG